VLPPGERAKNAVRLHHEKIIWLPWQRPLTNRKIWYTTIICTWSAFICFHLRCFRFRWHWSSNPKVYAVNDNTFCGDTAQNGVSLEIF